MPLIHTKEINIRDDMTGGGGGVGVEDGMQGLPAAVEEERRWV